MSGHEEFSFNPNKYIPTVDSEKSKKKKKYYKSGTGIGANIVDAETGQVTKHKVGSLDESRYFTIMINEGKEGVKLFYTSPEQYESHRNVSIDDNIKVEWHNKEHERRVAEFNPVENDDNTTKGDIIVK